MKSSCFTAVLAVILSTAASGQGLVKPEPTNVFRLSSQVTEQLPAPPPSPSDRSITVTPDQLQAIVRELRQMERTADLATVPTRGTSYGVHQVLPCDECDAGEALNVQMLTPAPQTIGTHVETFAPQVHMVPRHVPPPKSHSLLYGFDQSYPELPVVDVDNDAGCGCPDHYDVAVIVIDGKPTQVLNPEPADRNCCEVFLDNLSDLIHGRED